MPAAAVQLDAPLTASPGREGANVWSADIYARVRSIATALIEHERPDHTLTGTALTHETLARLAESEWDDTCPSHRLSVAVRVARRLLIDHERARAAAKRGGPTRRRLAIDPDRLAHARTADELEEIHETLRELAALHERQADVVELRFFLGFTERQAAHFLGVSERTVRNDWVAARAWLAARLNRG